MQVDLDTLQSHLNYRDKINDTPLDEIVWVRGGKLVQVDTAVVDDWRFVGLSNVTFAKEHLLDSDPFIPASAEINNQSGDGSIFTIAILVSVIIFMAFCL